MPGKSTFREELRSYLGRRAAVIDRRTGKALKATQKRLAQELSMRPETLSRKLSGSLRLTEQDIHDIGSTLIYWKRITRRTQLQLLLGLGGYPLSEDEWQKEPWNSLIDDSSSKEAAPEAHGNHRAVSSDSEATQKSTLPSHNDYFTGREAYLAQISQYFEAGESLPVCISGLGGMGKTQLALAYAYRHYNSKKYRAALWVNAAEEATIEASYRSIAEELDLPEQNEQKIRHVVGAVRRWLGEHTGWLLVMDNADDLYLARAYFPAIVQGHILLTTRSEIIDIRAQKVELEHMEPDEALFFLLLCSHKAHSKADLDDIDESTRAFGRQLVELVGRLPLALDQAGAFIRETSCSVEGYVALYEEIRYSLLERRGGRGSVHGDHPESVAVTFALCFKKAEQQHSMAAEILYFSAFLRPDAIPDELFLREPASAHDRQQFEEGMAALRRYSLVKRSRSDNTYSIHRLVQAVLVDTMPPELIVEWKSEVIYDLDRTLPRNYDYRPTPEENRALWTSAQRVLPHVLAYTEWTEPNPEVSRADFFLRVRLGTCIMILELQTPDTAPLYLRALAIAKQLQWEDNTFMALALSRVAETYSDDGKHEEAEEAMLHAFSIFDRCFTAEKNYPPIADKMHDVAHMYVAKGDFIQAELWQQKAIAHREAHCGPVHHLTASSLFVAGTTYIAARHDQQGEALLRRSLAIWDELGTPDHPEASFAAYCLAVLLDAALGQYEEAEALFLRSSRSMAAQLGPTHPQAIKLKRRYTSFLRRQGRNAEADALEAGGELPD